MSIPPLVCSTPPPPDQCEDDKDSEDFDIRYNLSQDEDEDSTEYEYGTYSSYNKFESNTVTNKIPTKIEISTIKETNIEILNESIKTEEYSPTTKSPLNNNSKDNEEVIEDLDLKFDQVSINSGKLSQTDEEEISKEESSNSQKDELTEINDTGTFPILEDDVTQGDNILVNEVLAECSRTLDLVEPLDLVQQSDAAVINPIDDKSVNLENTTESPSLNNESPTKEEVKLTTKLEVSDLKPDETLEDDEFGDFDDFKFASTESQANKVSEMVDVCENPWGSKEDEDDFGNFKASFDEPAITEPKIEHSTVAKINEEAVDDDDDFGDFDDFQSSSANVNRESESEQGHQEPVFHLQSPEIQQQTIETVISSIFEHDISDTMAVFDGKLETLLCETWGHLMDIDVRQPYMVNWNNSLGQKTLLKALCIDSRNILFGPKWAHMPKYATNLSTAPLQPLQPQKQSASSSFPSEPFNPDKTTSKAPGDNWVDPFAPNGKEFTYAEALLLDLEHLMATLDLMAHNHSTLKISDLLNACNVDSSGSAAPPRPTELVFEQTASENPEKIYSSTLNIQPLRQINLPDTHIFTPTDSEIPRSKTIHYDHGSSILSPQPVAESAEDEYSDFQDFKASTNTIPTPLTNPKVMNTNEPSITSQGTTASSSISYQTSILQPIKLETTLPTLNWPDPGQVKETFEDFSDFVSNTPWQEKEESSPTHPSICAIDTPMTISDISKGDTKFVLEDNTAKATYDDDFDTFQSAIPPTSLMCAPKDIQGLSIPKHNNTFKSIDSLPTSTLKKQPDLVTEFSGFGELSNNISHANTFNPIETKPMSQTYIPNNTVSKTEITQTAQGQKNPLASTPSVNSQVLQPTRFSSSAQSKPASGQILQPLSLEGYSQINWPNPGDTLDLRDLSRFNPVETLPSLKGDLNSGNSKNASPAHSHKSKVSDDDWGDFVSSEPKQSAPQATQPGFVDNDEWTDFFSCSSTQPHNGLNTISLNVHTNLNTQKAANRTKYNAATNQLPLELPKLNYVTPKTNSHRVYSDRHFQNL